MTEQTQSKVWYKEPWPWILMAGPICVVLAATSMFFVAAGHAPDLVSDDYYQDGKHIELQLHRDEEAAKRNIQAEVLINPEHNAAKVLLSGKFDSKQAINLQFLHPALKANDQIVQLIEDGTPSGNKATYTAVFKPLPYTNHWYVRIFDAAGKWRVEKTWIVSQGDSLSLHPKDKLSNHDKIDDKSAAMK